MAPVPISHELYEEDCFQITQSLSENNRDFSFFTLGGEADEPEKIFERSPHMEKIKSEGLDEKQFASFKRVQVANTVRGFESTSSIANGFLNSVFDGGDILDYADILGKVTVEDANSLIRRIFAERNYAMSVVRPVDN